MPQSVHRKKGGGINEREPSAFIAYTYDSKTMPPCKIQSAKAKQKVLDEITGFARSRHPVKVYCYQWTTSNSDVLWTACSRGERNKTLTVH